MKRIVFGRHARRQMQLYRITLAEVEAIIRYSEHRQPSIHGSGREDCYGQVGTRGWIRVVIHEDAQQITVVTAHPRRHRP